MKKKNILLSLLGLLIILSFGSCQKDLEIWDSATRQYAGKYVYAIYSEDMSKQYSTYADHGELWIYNSAKNVPNEIWLQDEAGLIGLKSMYTITGDASLFKSVSDAYESLPDNLKSVDDNPAHNSALKAAPKSASDEKIVEASYVRSAILEAKIIPNAVTTKGGNVSDSIYIKLKTYGANVKFKSIVKPENTWAKPGVPEYAWKFDSVTPNSENDETLIIAGYRYTGFSEDLY